MDQPKYDYFTETRDLINEIADNMKSDGDLFQETYARKEKFYDIRDHHIKIPLYTEFTEKTESFYKETPGTTKEEKVVSLMFYLLHKLVEAPAPIIMQGTIIFIIPLIARSLEEYEESKKPKIEIFH
jgi:hypothetical protein